MSKATLNTILFRTLHITSLALLGLSSASNRFFTFLGITIPRILPPLFEPRLLTDAKFVSMASMVGTGLTLSLSHPSTMNAPLFASLLYLLDMHHQPGEVHIIMEHR